MNGFSVGLLGLCLFLFCLVLGFGNLVGWRLNCDLLTGLVSL